MNLAFGAADAWSAAVYGETNPSTTAFLANQFNNFSGAITDAGKKFYQAGLEAFNHFNGSEAMRFARKVISSINGAFDTPYIHEYRTLEQMQNASTLMQRWVMANPTVRGLYHQQLCDGYSETYTDKEPGRIGDQHYDYRVATQGLVKFDEEDGWKTSIYFEELKEGDRDLLLEEQVAIAHTWSALEALAALGEDPTSANGGKL